MHLSRLSGFPEERQWGWDVTNMKTGRSLGSGGRIPSFAFQICSWLSARTGGSHLTLLSPGGLHRWKGTTRSQLWGCNDASHMLYKVRSDHEALFPWEERQREETTETTTLVSYDEFYCIIKKKRPRWQKRVWGDIRDCENPKKHVHCCPNFRTYLFLRTTLSF